MVTENGRDCCFTGNWLLRCITRKKPKLKGIFVKTTHSSCVSADFTQGGTAFYFFVISSVQRLRCNLSITPT